MTAEELIEQVRVNLGDPNIDNVKDAILALWGHGVTDAGSGDMQAPCGHFIRQDRWIVVTNEQGFEELTEYDTVADAERAYAELEDAYADWSNDELDHIPTTDPVNDTDTDGNPMRYARED